jgi:CO/xanthine dehydrogenase Mo-binding subunit
MLSYASAQKGEAEIERVFANAYRVIEDTYYGPRQHQGYIEPHGCVVWFDEQGRLQVVSTNKTPFSLRDQLAKVLGMASDQVVVEVRTIGGDFGGKGHSIEEFPCAFLARAVGRPIKAVMTYTDELTAMDPQHEAKYVLRTAVNREGKIIAHELHAHQAAGAYGASRPNGPGAADGGLGCLDVYNIPNTRLESYMAYTNLVPSGNMRAPGAFHRGHAGEAHVDHIAREIEIDPIEFRLRNCLRPGDSTITGGHVSRPRAAEVLERLREETGWGKTPLPPNRGRGIALRDRHVGAGKTEIVFSLQPDGTVEALYGTPDQGGGSHTVLQRVAAATLGVDLNRVKLRWGNTAESHYDAGSGGSRTTTMVGRAAQHGAYLLKDRLEDLAAEVMGWPAGQVRIENDEFVVGDGSGERRSFDEVATRIAAGPAVEVIGAFDPAEEHHGDDVGDMNFYAYMIEVEVDPESGEVRPTEVVAVVDVGTVINPVAHQGQLDGGFVYGYGQTMTEELVHEDGRIVTASLGEYKLPTQMDTPRFRTILLEPDAGPGAFGAKAAGETTNTGVGGAIANAIYDAVGVRIMSNPITAEKVLEALQTPGYNRPERFSPGSGANAGTGTSV